MKFTENLSVSTRSKILRKSERVDPLGFPVNLSGATRNRFAINLTRFGLKILLEKISFDPQEFSAA